MTQTSVAAIPVGSDMSDLDLVLLDQDVVELFDDVDAILCAALRPRRRQPAPPVAGCAFSRPRFVARSSGDFTNPGQGESTSTAPRSGALRARRASQREVGEDIPRMTPQPQSAPFCTMGVERRRDGKTLCRLRQTLRQ
jgi:hypothetical protein